MTPIRIGTVAALLAVAMLVTEHAWQPIFTVRLTDSIAIPLWILAAIYAGLQFYLFHLTKKKLDLTEAELDRWGGDLERVTPTILHEYEKKTPVREIAARIEEAEGIPSDVTLRYIIALARHARSLADNPQD